MPYPKYPHVEQIKNLTAVLQNKVPKAMLDTQALPLVPEIKLILIEHTYPQAGLSAAQVEYLMDEPPYWAFCWASGQVMARYVLDNTEQFKSKTVIDFGCGSGVAAIAAKKAGAKEVFAVDIDEAALLATQTNASINSEQLTTVSSLSDIPIKFSDATLLVADVFYDEQNIPMLHNFVANFEDVIIADSRVKPDVLTGFKETSRVSSATVPDLGEASDFNSVGLYRIST